MVKSESKCIRDVSILLFTILHNITNPLLKGCWGASTAKGMYRVERNYANIVFSPAWKEKTAIARSLKLLMYPP